MSLRRASGALAFEEVEATVVLRRVVWCGEWVEGTRTWKSCFLSIIIKSVSSLWTIACEEERVWKKKDQTRATPTYSYLCNYYVICLIHLPVVFIHTIFLCQQQLSAWIPLNSEAPGSYYTHTKGTEATAAKVGEVILLIFSNDGEWRPDEMIVVFIAAKKNE